MAKADTAPPVLVLLGGAGDLALRMLMPSLHNLAGDGVLPEGLRVIAVGRAPGDADSYRKEVCAALERRQQHEADCWGRLAPMLDYCSADVTKPEGAKTLAKAIGEHSLLVFQQVEIQVNRKILASSGEKQRQAWR